MLIESSWTSSWTSSYPLVKPYYQYNIHVYTFSFSSSYYLSESSTTPASPSPAATPYIVLHSIQVVKVYPSASSYIFVIFYFANPAYS